MTLTNGQSYEVNMTVNGRPVRAVVSPTKMLVDFLRQDLGLTGTKKGCGSGECGACTVLFNGEPVNACLVPVVRCAGSSVMTVEGISETELFRKIQDAMGRSSAFQCGFCAPGMMVSLYALFRENDRPTEEEIRSAIAGNLCRCSGYKKIVDSSLELSGQAVLRGGC